MVHSATTSPLADATESADSVRARILTAAGLLFDEFGVNAVSVEQLVSQSGVSFAELHRHYSCKRELINAYALYRARQRRAEIDMLRAAHPGDPRAVLMAIAQFVDDSGSDGNRREGMFVHFAAEAAELEHPLRTTVIELRKWYIGFITEQVSALGHHHPEPLAAALLMVLTGAITAHTLEGVSTPNLAVKAFTALLDSDL